MSLRSNTFEMCLTSFDELLRVTGLQPFLSFWTSKTKFKSPQELSRCSQNREVGLERFGRM